MNERLSTRAIIEHEDKFLLVRHTFDDSFWALPGGTIEKGESIEVALTRELVEETGIKPIIGNLLFIHQLQENDAVIAREFIFHVTNGHDFTDIKIDETTHGENELSEIAFVNPQGKEILPRFLANELTSEKLHNLLTTQIKTSDIQR